MSKNILIALIALVASGVVNASDIVEQRYSVLSVAGEAKIWSKESMGWKDFDKTTKASVGSTIKTSQKSNIRFSFEPSITICLKENTIFSNNKMLLNKSINAIRMSHRLEQGEIELSMPAKLNYKLFMTVNTPSASINIRGGKTKISVTDGVTSVLALKQSVLIENLSSGIKTVLQEGAKAIISPNSSGINIGNIKDIATNKTITVTEAPIADDNRPTVAILSIQSKEVSKLNLAPLSDIVAGEIGKKSNTKVIYLDDVKSMLQSEGVDGLLSCYTDSCISKIGAYLGVDNVVIGRLGRLGKSFVFDLKIVDVLRDKTLNRASVSVSEDMGKILTLIPNIVGDLVSKTNMSATEKDHSTLNSAKLSGKKMISIKGDEFMMGTTSGIGAYDELPRHKVILKSFNIDKFEVTKQEFTDVMGYNPSQIKGCLNCPIDNISWAEADEYCKKIGGRLPTEAEWEYSCRAGTKTTFHYGNTLSSFDANFNGKKPFGGASVGPYRKKALPVGNYKPNNWGLFDMHGNVAEWCSDWSDPTYYESSAKENPQGPSKGKFRVVRGGSWKDEGKHLRSANRNSYNPIIKLPTLGFRCVKDID